MKTLEQYVPLNRIVGFSDKVTTFVTLSHVAIPVFRYPSLLYGSALSTGSNVSDVKATDQLEDAQVVSADPTQLLQVWS